MPIPLLYTAGGALVGFFASDGVDKVNKTLLYAIAGLIVYKVVK